MRKKSILVALFAGFAVSLVFAAWFAVGKIWQSGKAQRSEASEPEESGDWVFVDLTRTIRLPPGRKAISAWFNDRGEVEIVTRPMKEEDEAQNITLYTYTDQGKKIRSVLVFECKEP